MSTRPSVIVVGAGFSGLLTALHLLSAPDGPQVRLLERRGVFARGRAYSSDNPGHLLNVRTANMSAFPDQPAHFVDWLAPRRGEGCRQGFATRGEYGDYLQDLLAQAVVGAYGVDRLLLELDEAVDASPVAGGWRVATAMGRALEADALVLALGSLPPPAPPFASPAVLASPRYIADPWALDPARELGRRVLLVGTGLTMVDVAFALDHPDRQFSAVSRRGLLPRAHLAAPPAAGAPDLRGTPGELLRRVRFLAGRRDWREAVDQVRGSALEIWRAWPLAERRRFLRHLRPWWDVHRHRMAPAVDRRIQAMRAAGRLRVGAAAIQTLRLAGDGIEAELRPRGTCEAEVATFDAVVNCTGQGGDLHQANAGLVRALLDRGLVRPDPLRLGFDVDDRGRPLTSMGEASAGLHAVGPLTRAAFWEATAVPDIRLQAAETARAVLATFGVDA